MTQSLEADVALLHIVGGAARITPPPGSLAQIAPRRCARGRGQDALLLSISIQARRPPAPSHLDHLAQLAAERGYAGGFEVAIGVEGGAELALKTMNPRLGILGGLSILGTSGIVRPFSCSAYIASIHQGIDVARANGVRHIAACTGNASEDAMRRRYALPEIALIEMGDFAGAVLKHLRRAPVEKLSLCGGFGKISKLAGGHLDLHSRHSSIDLPQLAGWAAALGASTALQDSMRAANTSQQALAQAHAEGVALGDAVCAHALRFARGIVPTEVALEVFAIDRQGNLVGQACEERR